MPYEDCAGSVYALRLRLAKLDADGTIHVGANNTIVTEALVRIDWDWEYFTPADIEKANGSGSLCVNVTGKPVPKRLNITALEVCTPDPFLSEFLAGGDVLSDGGDTIGYAFPELGSDPMPNGLSVEAWSRAWIGDEPAAVDPYIWWAFPRLYLRHGAKGIANAAQDNIYSGYGIENQFWFDGPEDDWPVASDRALQYVRTDSLPEPSCEPQTSGQGS